MGRRSQESHSDVCPEPFRLHHTTCQGLLEDLGSSFGCGLSHISPELVSCEPPNNCAASCERVFVVARLAGMMTGMKSVAALVRKTGAWRQGRVHPPPSGVFWQPPALPHARNVRRQHSNAEPVFEATDRSRARREALPGGLLSRGLHRPRRCPDPCSSSVQQGVHRSRRNRVRTFAAMVTTVPFLTRKTSAVFLQVQAVGEKVVVKVAAAETKTTGGILLPNEAQRKPTSGVTFRDIRWSAAELPGSGWPQ